jgi:lactoylglutathione lyase
MNFGYVILYVNDVEASLSFYERAFAQKRRLVTPEGDYGELEGTVPIAFARTELAKDSSGLDIGAGAAAGSTLPFEIAFVTDDIDANVQTAVEAGAELVKPVAAKPWGQKVAYVKDLNGCISYKHST